mgnify:FL=1|jgi:hypothetical protein|tara:strand:- start:97 stop:348 length:252 start_codon:yes stop_codon:yes gene_type:complete
MKAKVVLILTILSFLNPLNAVETEEFKKIIRLQSLTSFAKDKGNFDLACKAQTQIVKSIKKVKMLDVVEQSQKELITYCVDKS